MFIRGKVETAKMGMYHDGIEVAVIDKDVVKPSGGRPQYTAKIVRGWPGLEDLKALKKQGATEQDLAAFAAQIVLPQEDTLLELIVVDIAGKAPYMRLVCEVAGQP
jgi:hypothetical protein